VTFSMAFPPFRALADFCHLPSGRGVGGHLVHMLIQSASAVRGSAL